VDDAGAGSGGLSGVGGFGGPRDGQGRVEGLRPTVVTHKVTSWISVVSYFLSGVLEGIDAAKDEWKGPGPLSSQGDVSKVG
jgi:hypothetical protein